MFLTADELHALTGYRRKSGQIQWLRAKRWRFEITREGFPRVARADAEARLVGKRVPAPPMRSADEPWRESGLSPFGWLDLNFEELYLLARPIAPTLTWPGASFDEAGGIYFLFAGPRLAYVGQTIDFEWRLREHADRFAFDGVRTVSAPQLLRDAIEAFYIARESPPFNAKRPPVPKILSRRLL